jgi:polyphosphate kinase 2
VNNLLNIDLNNITQEQLDTILSKDGILKALKSNHKKNYEKILNKIDYEKELEKLQIELIKFQSWVESHNKRVVILFEGRDGAGKGGTIKRFTEHLSPRSLKIVALTKPSDIEQQQWYFQRYVKELPKPGQICFFDRSWYNRTVVEPVMGFCTKEEYELALKQIPQFEQMLVEDGIIVIKFYLSISKEEQAKRFEERRKNPLKNWKLSPVDEKAQDMWENYDQYEKRMFQLTDNRYCPWIIIDSNDKKAARLETIKQILNAIDYEGKEATNINLIPNKNIVSRPEINFYKNSK